MIIAISIATKHKHISTVHIDFPKAFGYATKVYLGKEEKYLRSQGVKFGQPYSLAELKKLGSLCHKTGMECK